MFIDDFVLRALAAGIGIVLPAGPLGCFMVWRRLAYFGTTLAHGALLGVAAALWLQIDPMFGVIGICLVISVGLALLDNQGDLAGDTMMGVIAHSALALGLVAIALHEAGRADLIGYLFGDILAVSSAQVLLIFAVAVGLCVVLFFTWSALLAETVSPDLAKVNGLPTVALRITLTMMTAVLIGLGIKLVGLLLIVSLLILPAASARRLAATPEQMAFWAVALGILAVALGLAGSVLWDLPTGPAIALAATLSFVAVHVVPAARRAMTGRR